MLLKLCRKGLAMCRRTSCIRAFRLVFLASVAWCCGSGIAFGTTYVVTPKPVMLLKDSKRFIAQDGWNSVALYRIGDATAIHRFPAPERVQQIAVTPDEKRLLVACSDGSVAVWDVETGKRLWEQTGKQTGLGYYHASLAHDGESCIVCDGTDQAIVFRTTTGERLGVVQFPPKQTNIVFAAYSPDGKTGAFMGLGDRLHTFDVAMGTVKDTGIAGAWPVRYSVDGKHIAFRSNNSGTEENLRLVSMDGTLTMRDLGSFSHIGHIKPTDDGAFLVTGRVGNRHEKTAVIVGVRVRPGNEKAEELWERPNWSGVDVKTDFRPNSMIGVSTDAWLVTTVTDLRSGALLQEVDNRANSRPEMMSYSSTGVEAWLRRSWLRLAVVVVGLVMATTAILVWRQVRRRRMARTSGNAGSAI